MAGSQSPGSDPQRASCAGCGARRPFAPAAPAGSCCCRRRRELHSAYRAGAARRALTPRAQTGCSADAERESGLRGKKRKRGGAADGGCGAALIAGTPPRSDPRAPALLYGNGARAARAERLRE
eukprot:gene3254-7378_t